MRPSLLINSLYIRSAPLSLHTARKGGSLTSSIGASKSGNSGNFICPIDGMTLIVLYIAANLQQTFLAMEYRSVKGFTGWAQFGFLLCFIAIGFILAGAAQIFAVSLLQPKGISLLNTDAIMKAMLAPENVGVARLNQVLSTFALLFIPALLFSFFVNGKKMLWLGFSKHINPKQIVIGFVIMFLTSLAAGPLFMMSKSIIAHFPSIDATAKKLEDLYNSQTAVLGNIKTLPELFIGIFIMAFIPAIFEEAFFRGTLQNLLVKWIKNPIVAILITSFLFSLVHSSIYLFLSRMALGFTLGLMYYYTKNIWINIIAHLINNTIALGGMYVTNGKINANDLDKANPIAQWIMAAVACFALVKLFTLLIKYSEKNKAIIEEKEFALANNDHFQNNN